MPSLVSSFFLFPQFFAIPTEILRIRLHYRNNIFVTKSGLSPENFKKTELSELVFIYVYLKQIWRYKQFFLFTPFRFRRNLTMISVCKKTSKLSCFGSSLPEIYSLFYDFNRRKNNLQQLAATLPREWIFLLSEFPKSLHSESQKLKFCLSCG